VNSQAHKWSSAFRYLLGSEAQPGEAARVCGGTSISYFYNTKAL